MNDLQEEVVVNTTDNGGAGLDSPKLPIKQKNIFRRYSELKKKSKDKTPIKND